MRKLVELVHRQAQFAIKLSGGCVGGARFQPPLHAAEACVQRVALIGITKQAQETTNVVGQPPGFFHPTQRRRKRDSAGMGVLENAAFERTALPGPVRVHPAGAIRAQGSAWLAKARHRYLRTRDHNGQSKRLQFPDIIARSEPDVPEESAIAAEAAGQAKLFARIHGSTFRRLEVGVQAGVQARDRLPCPAALFAEPREQPARLTVEVG